MRSNDLDAFKETLTSVYSLYRTDLSADIIDLWWHALKPHNLGDVRKALAEHVAEPEGGQFFPKPADVIKRIVPDKKTQKALCDHCGGDLSGWTKFGSGRVCNPCYSDYLDNKWDPIKEKAA